MSGAATALSEPRVQAGVPHGVPGFASDKALLVVAALMCGSCVSSSTRQIVANVRVGSVGPPKFVSQPECERGGTFVRFRIHKEEITDRMANEPYVLRGQASRLVIVGTTNSEGDAFHECLPDDHYTVTVCGHSEALEVYYMHVEEFERSVFYVGC